MKKIIFLIVLTVAAPICMAQTNETRRSKIKTPQKNPEPSQANDLRRAKVKTPPKNPAEVTYEEAFVDIYTTMGRVYPAFEIKGVDWQSVGNDLLPRVKTVQTDEEFGLLCMELVARLQDSHAELQPGSAELPRLAFPQWDPGFACLIDDQNLPVVYYVDIGSPAKGAGIKPGMTVVSINGMPADQCLQNVMLQLNRYTGYSSDRYLMYHAAQMLPRQTEKDARVCLVLKDGEGKEREIKIPATLGLRYLPRLPVPIRGIDDDGPVSWTMLEDKVGYIYVRKMNSSLNNSLDQAVKDLSRAKGLIIDVRGNSGGGFDAQSAFDNFNLDCQTDRPQYKGSIALLTDARCISAGEGWASWFIANKRATVFGETTAGASSRKQTYTLKNGLYKVVIPVKAYTGFLDRPIEGRGLEPDVPVRQNAADLTDGKDAVLQKAKQWLLQKSSE